MIRRLCVDDAQTFIDVMDEVRSTFIPESGWLKVRLTCSAHQILPDVPDLPPPVRKKCLKSLYRTCGCRSLIPNALKIPMCYDRNGHPLYKGGFADVWKGEHRGQDVAVEVLRIYSTSDFQKIIDVGPGLCFISPCQPID